MLDENRWKVLLYVLIYSILKEQNVSKRLYSIKYLNLDFHELETKLNIAKIICVS